MKIQFGKLLKKRAILIIAPFLFLGCETDNGNIGEGTIIGLPLDADSMHLRIVSFTQKVDSVIVALNYSNQASIGGYIGNRIVGTMEYDFIGSAEASIVTQVVPVQLNMDFGDNPVVDSVKMFLRFNGQYGDTNKAMDLEVLEITESLSRDSSYFSSFKPVTGQKVGELLAYEPRPKSRVTNGSVIISPSVIIPLDNNYFQTKIADIADGSNSNLADFDDFIEYLKGFQIKAVKGDGSMLYFNLSNATSRIVISYHNDSDTNEAVLNFAQDKSSLPISFSVFSQNYDNVVNAISNPDTNSPGEMTTYVQAMGGVATVFKIPDVLNSLEEGAVINRAFLEVPVQRGIMSGLPPAGALEIRVMTSKGPSSTIRDFYFDSRQTGDGTLRLGELRNNRYIFELTEHIFEVINEDRSPNLAIVPVSKGTTATRTILKGGNDPMDPIKLIVYYTKP